MARTALVVKSRRFNAKLQNAKRAGRKLKLATRAYNRCKKCGRVHGYLRKFALCRICFRELANIGEITGVTKSSW